MLLIGTMDWASTKRRGVFTCPVCGESQQYRLRESRPFLTLYFIPIVPLGGITEVAECTVCRESFEPFVLTPDFQSQLKEGANATAQHESLDSETNMTERQFEEDLLKVIALMMIEDGHVTESEIRIARRLFENITEMNLSRDDLGRMCSSMNLHRMKINGYLATVVPRRSHEEKLLLVQAMFGVAGADGEISPGRMQSLLQSQEILQLEEREFMAAVNATSQWLT